MPANTTLALPVRLTVVSSFSDLTISASSASSQPVLGRTSTRSSVTTAPPSHCSLPVFSSRKPSSWSTAREIRSGPRNTPACQAPAALPSARAASVSLSYCHCTASSPCCFDRLWRHEAEFHWGPAAQAADAPCRRSLAAAARAVPIGTRGRGGLPAYGAATAPVPNAPGTSSRPNLPSLPRAARRSNPPRLAAEREDNREPGPGQQRRENYQQWEKRLDNPTQSTSAGGGSAVVRPITPPAAVRPPDVSRRRPRRPGRRPARRCRCRHPNPPARAVGTHMPSPDLSVPPGAARGTLPDPRGLTGAPRSKTFSSENKA